MSHSLSDSPPYASLTSPAFDTFAAAAYVTVTERQAALDAKWHRERYNQWSCSQPDGVIRFTNASGAGLEADVQFLGSYSPTAQSWEWAWNNPHVNAELAHDAHMLRAYGIQHGFATLTTGMIRATPDEAPLLMSAAFVITGVEGVYWGQSGAVIVALGYRNVREISA